MSVEYHVTDWKGLENSPGCEYRIWNRRYSYEETISRRHEWRTKGDDGNFIIMCENWIPSPKVEWDDGMRPVIMRDEASVAFEAMESVVRRIAENQSLLKAVSHEMERLVVDALKAVELVNRSR